MGAVKIGAGVIVVVPLHAQLQVWMPADVLMNQVPLVLDAVALIAVLPRLLVLPGQPPIGIAAVNLRFLARKKLYKN